MLSPLCPTEVEHGTNFVMVSVSVVTNVLVIVVGVDPPWDVIVVMLGILDVEVTLIGGVEPVPVGPGKNVDVVWPGDVPMRVVVVVEGEVGCRLLVLLDVAFTLRRGIANAEPNSRAATERYEVCMIRY